MNLYGLKEYVSLPEQIHSTRIERVAAQNSQKSGILLHSGLFSYSRVLKGVPRASNDELHSFAVLNAICVPQRASLPLRANRFDANCEKTRPLAASILIFFNPVEKPAHLSAKTEQSTDGI